MCYTHVELEARHEIELEKYIKKVQIEARIMGETGNQSYPSCCYQIPEYTDHKISRD